MIWSTFGRRLVQLPGISAFLTILGILPVANGGTGRASHTAYAIICGGTTGTGAQQSIASVGAAGQLLTSNGAGALPTFQAAPAGGLTAVSQQTFVADGTYTPTSGTVYCLAIVVGAGGPGGDATGQVSAAGGGGGGGTAIGLFAVASLTGQAVDVGTTSGASSSIGAVISATGGSAGGSDSSSATAGVVAGGAGGIGSGGNLNIRGEAGGMGVKAGTTGATMRSGNGGSSAFGGGANGITASSDTVGNAGGAYGGGGSGGGSNSTTDDPGGAGAPGVVYIIEYRS